MRYDQTASIPLTNAWGLWRSPCSESRSIGKMHGLLTPHDTEPVTCPKNLRTFVLPQASREHVRATCGLLEV